MSATAAPAPVVPRHNLPLATSILFGRDADLGRVRRALGAARLVTLTGPGGVGKTRLALAAAEGQLAGYPDGAWLVELAPLADPELVPAAVAAVLGVREQPGRALAETLAGALRERRLLLLLDNCEHVREACAELVATLLVAAPGIQVLATSRAPLGLAGERRLVVPPLALPVADEMDREAMAGTPAVALFVARAHAIEPGFALEEGNAADVAAICARLDGLPLAIELAAARIKVRTPAALLADLTARLEVLVGGRRGLPARQRTVRGLLDWSFTLLGPGEQALFARLSVFSGGGTAEAAQAVCVIEDDLPMSAEEGLASLVEQSLVQPPRDGRYAMLETVREYAGYALERLSAVEDEEVTRRQHLAYFLALAEEAGPHLRGPDQVAWLARLESEHANLRAALGWSRDSGAAEEGLRLGGALWLFWGMRGHLGEGRTRLEELLGRGGGTARARAGALVGAGRLADAQGDTQAAMAHLEEAVALARAHGDLAVLAAALNVLGFVAQGRGDYGRAGDLYEEALACWREVGGRRGAAVAAGGLGSVALYRGEYRRACEWYEESLALYREVGDLGAIAVGLENLGALATKEGDLERGDVLVEEALAIYRSLGDRRQSASALRNLGWAALQRGEYGRSAALLEEALEPARALGDRRTLARVIHNLADLAQARGEYEGAAVLYDEALALYRKQGERLKVVECLHDLGSVALARGARRRAGALCAESLALARDLGAQPQVAVALEGLARVAAAQGQPEADPRRAARLLGAAAALRASIGAAQGSTDQGPVELAREAALAALGEGAFAAAWAEGQAMTLEQAVAEALADSRPLEQGSGFQQDGVAPA